MPKPLFQDNGSGMHTHQSLWKDGANLFFDANGYGHAQQAGEALRRRAAEARPGHCWRSAPRPPTPTSGWCPASRPRSTWSTPCATAAPPSGSRCTPSNPKAKRIEFRPPDCTCNPYLSFAAMLMAGLDGIKNELDPGRSGGQEHLRTAPRGGGKYQDRSGLPRCSHRCPGGRPRLPAGGWSVHSRTCWTPGSTTRRNGRSTPSGCARIRMNITSTSTCRNSIQSTQSSEFR